MSNSSALQAVRDTKMLAFAFGAVALVAGLALIFLPEQSVKAVAVIVGIFAAIGGIMLIAGSFANRKYDGMLWLLMLVRGLVNLGIGIALVAWPIDAVSTIILLFGIMLIATAVLGLLGALVAPSGFDRGGLVGQALVELAIGIVLFAWPEIAVRTFMLVVGIGLALLGASLIANGARLREANFTG
jgi:uncharacterized membrane protein HdeD (DUF308 family)